MIDHTDTCNCRENVIVKTATTTRVQGLVNGLQLPQPTWQTNPIITIKREFRYRQPVGITEKCILKAMHNKSTGVFFIIFVLSACCCKIHNTGAIWLFKSTRWNIAAVINTTTQDFNLEVHKHADFPGLWYLNNPSHPLPLFPYTTQKQKHILPGWGKA